MAKKNSGKYFIKNTADGTYGDVSSVFDGINILSVDGLNSRGKAINVFTQQWIGSQKEDFLITTNDENDNPVIIRENVDITVVFISGQRYADAVIDVQEVYDSFVDYMTGSDIWIASTYVDKQVHCVSLDKAEPKTVKLHRGGDTYIIGELTLHTLDKPSSY